MPGALVSPTSGGTINWEPPAYSPDTGLFYVAEHNGYFDLLPDRSRPARLDGSRRPGGSERVGSAGNFLDGHRSEDRQDRVAPAIIPAAASAAAAAACSRRPGSWCSRGDAGGNIVAYDAATGAPLWHSRIGNVTNAPMTFIARRPPAHPRGRWRHAVCVRAPMTSKRQPGFRSCSPNRRRPGTAEAVLSPGALGPARRALRSGRNRRRRSGHASQPRASSSRTRRLARIADRRPGGRNDREPSPSGSGRAACGSRATARNCSSRCRARRSRGPASTSRRCRRPIAVRRRHRRRGPRNSRSVVRTLPSGQDPEAFDLSLDGRTLYVSNEETAEMSVVDLRAGRSSARVKIGEEPEGVTTRPDGRAVYVTCEGDNTVCAVDTASYAVLARIPDRAAAPVDRVHSRWLDDVRHRRDRKRGVGRGRRDAQGDRDDGPAGDLRVPRRRHGPWAPCCRPTGGHCSFRTAGRSRSP